MKKAKRVLLKLDWATHEAAKFACETWHYSKCIPKSKLVKIGAWESDKFIGVVIFGVGATSSLVKQYGLSMTQGCELVRVALSNHKTSVTRIVSIALKFLKKSNPGLKLVVSFADPGKGHHGGIYQGGNWIYAGRTQASDEYIYEGRRWQGRSFRHRFKGMEKDPSVTVVKGSSKYRYLMPLDEAMRKQIAALSKPYPKKSVSSKVSVATTDQVVESGAIPTDTVQLSEIS